MRIAVAFADLDAFDILSRLYDSMNFPRIALEESLKHSEGKRLLHNARCHVMRYREVGAVVSAASRG